MIALTLLQVGIGAPFFFVAGALLIGGFIHAGGRR